MLRYSNDGAHTRNSEVLASFVDYCIKNPDQRFWQALRNWSTCNYIFASGVPLLEVHTLVPGTVKDTFYFEGRCL